MTTFFLTETGSFYEAQATRVIRRPSPAPEAALAGDGDWLPLLHPFAPTLGLPATMFLQVPGTPGPTARTTSRVTRVWADPKDD